MQREAFEVEAELEFSKRQQQADAASRQPKTLSQHVNYIQEELLTLKCPVAGCGQAFTGDNVDFDECLVLRCARNPHHLFCGWCLTDCGEWEAAHAHVGICAMNETPDKRLFASRALFDRCHRRRWLRLIQRYLDNAQNIDRQAVIDTCKEKFAHLGIDFDQLK